MWVCFYLLIYLLFWDRVSSSPSWPWARSVDKNALELLIPLFPPLKCWYDSRHSYAGCGCILQSTDIYFWSFPPPPESWHFELVPHPRRPSSALSSTAFETPSNVFFTPCWVSGWLSSCNGWHDLSSFFMGSARLYMEPMYRISKCYLVGLKQAHLTYHLLSPSSMLIRWQCPPLTESTFVPCGCYLQRLWHKPAV